MPKSRGSPVATVLSRFFDNNVRLVAGICSRCYNEENDVKIVAINRKFLEKVETRKNLNRTTNSLHNNCSPDGDDASQPTFDHCQNDRLKLPTTTSTNDNYALITERASRQIKPRLNYNNDCKETTSLCTTRNFPKCANENRDPQSVSDFFSKVGKSEKWKEGSFDQKSSEFQKINLAKLKCPVGKISSSIPNSQGSPTKDENCNSIPDICVNSKVKTENSGNLKLSKLQIKKSLSPSNLQELTKENFKPVTSPNLYLKTETKTETFSRETYRVKVENPIFSQPKRNVNLAKLRIKKIPLWSPPRSPHNLIEESLFRDPWSLLVATIFLNKTSCMCARPRVEEFLRDFSGPWEVLEKHPSELEKYFLVLGLFKKRAEQVWRMSHDYVHKNWRNARELYGIGKYGENAYRMFVLGDLDVEPTDRFLRIYRDWAKMKEKQEKMCSEDD